MAVINRKTGERTHEGCVLTGPALQQTWTYDPICATTCTVWDAEKGEVVSVTLNHDYQPDLNLTAEVDATPEVRFAAAKSVVDKYVEKVKREDRSVWAELVCEAHDVTLKGGRVRVVRGRNIVHGTEGVVFWHGEDRYAPSWQHRPERVGFVTDDGTKLYTAATNLQAIDRDPPSLDEYTPTDEEAFELAWAEAKREFKVQ